MIMQVMITDSRLHDAVRYLRRGNRQWFGLVSVFAEYFDGILSSPSRVLSGDEVQTLC